MKPTRMHAGFVLIVGVLFVGAGCVPLASWPQTKRSASSPLIRVLVWQGPEPIHLEIWGRWSVSEQGKRLWESYGRAAIQCERTPDGLNVTVQKGLQTKSWTALGSVRVISSLPIVVKGTQQKRYRHGLEIHTDSNKGMQVVNTLPLEDYLKGVLQHETPFHWPLEALKAQAVAARTYALYQHRQRSHKRYDVTATASSQVYGGHDTERYRTNLAVNLTQGEYLVDEKGNILPAFYSACCGGHTEDGWALWRIPVGYPPLTGRKCPFCQGSPHFRWRRNLRSKDVQDRLNEQMFHGRLGLIKEIRVSERTRTGRAKTIEITTRDGRVFKMSSEEFRRIVGRQVIKSHWISFEMKGYYFDVLGRGWGHGVGLCQWGALGMAQKGYDYQEILRYYYPKTRIVHE